MMNYKALSITGLLASGILASTLHAQPPEGDGPGRGPRPGRGIMAMNPLAAALDVDKNQEISAEELENAAKSLKTLDKNGDGKLTFDELRPSFARDTDRPGFGRPRDGGPGDDAADRPRGERRFEFRGRERGDRERGRGPRDGDRPRPERGDAEGDVADRPRPEGRERGRGPERPDGFRPGPEAFVTRAMTFDADNDGKLNREELTKFAEELGRRARDARPGPGPRDGDRPGPRDGDRPDRERQDRERGDRETRPEAE